MTGQDGSVMDLPTQIESRRTICFREASKGSFVMFSIADFHVCAYRSRSIKGSQSGRYLAVIKQPVSYPASSHADE